MLSALFLTYAVIHIGIWLWGWKLWAETDRPVSLFLVLFGGTLLFYDNLRIGGGRFIGEGDLLYAMSVPAFAWHWALLPLLVIAAGSIARQAGLPGAANKFVMGAFCVVAVALSIHDIPKIFEMDLKLACLQDTVRYTTSLKPTQLCSPDAIPVPSGADAATVAIITNIIVLITGIGVWVKRRWPWMTMGALAMFVCAGPWWGDNSLPIANFGEICITLGLITTCAHFAKRRDGSRAPGAAGLAMQKAA
jgi:hypothetical protein